MHTAENSPNREASFLHNSGQDNSPRPSSMMELDELLSEEDAGVQGTPEAASKNHEKYPVPTGSVS